MYYSDKGIDGVSRGRGGERIGHVTVADEGDMIGSYLILRLKCSKDFGPPRFRFHSCATRRDWMNLKTPPSRSTHVISSGL